MAYLLHQLLSETASRLPNKEAVRFQGQGLSYAQLDRLTNQVARTLVSTGVQRGDRVGIYVNKSLASVISVFGVLKCGGVYVPLDPNAPANRLAYITRNCDIQVLLTSGGKLAHLPQFFSQGTPLETVVLVDGREQDDAELPESIRVIDWARVDEQEDGPLQPVGTIDTDLAYILYTSGSTGRPKGVMISHRTIFTFINWCYKTFHISREDRVTSHAPLHFDLSTFDIFVTLKAGGTVVIVPEKLSIFPVQLVKLLQNERISITYLVPSILTLMLSYGNLESYDLSALRLILFAGEVFPVKYLRKLVAKIPHADYYNLYGPTETNVCTYHKVQPEDLDPDRIQPLPIGKACENMEVFAVDDQGKLITLPEQEGELWVRGSCVAQGYWGDPEKTAKVFVENNFQPFCKEIVYRTGDIVKLAEGGETWIFIGRRDHMIKSRGYRIELGEIESALVNYQDIQEAVVVAIPDELIGNRLKGFVVPMRDRKLNMDELEGYLNKILPPYMIPESLELWDKLPKTSTGKIDRTLLIRNSMSNYYT
jgi:amino acid adenylation domain-containing protein